MKRNAKSSEEMIKEFLLGGTRVSDLIEKYGFSANEVHSVADEMEVKPPVDPMHLYNKKNFKRELRIGDVISCPSGKLKIKEIVNQDYYVCPWTPERSYISIDFRTKSGELHSWKSHLDGGYVVYASDKYGDGKDKLRDVLRRYGYSV